MTRICWLAFDNEQRRFEWSRWIFLSVILVQVLLCSARPDQYIPNPDGVQVRHVPAKTKIHVEPGLKYSPTKRDIGSSNPIEEGEDDEEPGISKETNDEYQYNNEEEIVNKTFTEVKPTTTLISPETEGTTESAVSQSFEESDILDDTEEVSTIKDSSAEVKNTEEPETSSSATSTAVEIKNTDVPTTSPVANLLETVSQPSSQKPSNSDNFAQAVLESKRHVNEASSLKQSTYVLVVLSLPVLWYLF